MPAGWIAAGTALVGAAASSDASRSASNTQADAARNAQATQQNMFNQTNDQQAPYRQAGNNALSSLSSRLGIGLNTAGLTPDQARKASLDKFAQGYGVKDWASQTAGQFDEATRTKAYDQAAVDATNSANGGGANYGSLDHQFDANDLKTNLAPNYDFILGQGLGAVNNQASVTGGLVGGNALKGINDYAQNYASNGYQQAYNNFNTNQTNIFNRLSSIAGIGQTANGQSATTGLGYASNIGSAQMAGGAAQAAGAIGQGNAISNGLNNAASWYASSRNPPPANNNSNSTYYIEQ